MSIADTEQAEHWNTGEGVAPGRIWVAFKCPTIIDGSSNSTCQIKQGYAIFENCSQTATAP